MSQFNDVGLKAFTCGEAIPQYTRVKLSAGKVVKCGATDKMIGITTRNTFAADEDVTVALVSKAGTVKATASAALTAGAYVYGKADGKVGPSAAGSFVQGIVLEDASGNGAIVEMIMIAGETAV